MMRTLLGAVVGVLVVGAMWLFVATMVTIIVTIGIWPGEATLTAGLLCPADRPDAFVVSDTYQPTPGQSAGTYALYCVGPGGERTSVGFLRPFAVLTVVHGVLLAGPVAWVGVRLRRRGAGRRGRPIRTIAPGAGTVTG